MSQDTRARRRLIAQGYRWVHTGGGTFGGAAGRSAYPSDDTYEHLVTGREVTFVTTAELHLSSRLPRRCKHLGEVSRLKGAKRLC